MKSFALQNGDLVLGQGGLLTVAGPSKVRQDLSIAMREPLGCDRFHPNWGSVLPNYIGEPITGQIDSLVKAEVYRLVRNYMAVKANEMQSEYLRGNRASFSADEIVINISSVDVVRNMDRLYVRVSLQTSGGSNVTLVATVEA
jgi:hypothetical protein